MKKSVTDRDNGPMTGTNGDDTTYQPMPPGPPPGKGRKITREEMEKRNHRIFALFIAGNSENEIARNVGLHRARINQILKAELKEAARHHQLLTDEALAIYVTRLEILIQRVWPKVASQDLKAIEVARRLLEQQARLYDLEEERMGAIPPMAEQELMDETNPTNMDDLSRYRLRHRRTGGDA